MATDSDPLRSAAHLNMVAHLSGPFGGGAVDSPVPFTGDGALTAAIDRVTRQPLLLVGLRQPLDARALAVTATVTPRDGGPARTTTVRFAPFTEAGAFLPLWSANTETAAPLDCALALTGPIEDRPPGLLIELRLVEGVLGKLLYVIGAEKARVRRQMRELQAVRCLDFQTDDADPELGRLGHALDRLGGDLGAPRFADRLAWDAARGQAASVAAREPDEAYQRRLAILRPFRLPTRARVEAAARASAHAGLVINEANAQLAVGIRLVSAPDDTGRRQFLAGLRATHLVQPGRPIPADRPLPSAVRRSLQRVLDRLGTSFALPAGGMIAPLLAEALDRVGRCRAALGVTRPWAITRAQDDAGGSRYELGLGVDVEAPPASELDLMAANLRTRTFAAGTDVGTLRLLESLTPRAAAADPIGRWLLAGVGVRTVHALASGRWYLSHAPTFGVLVEGEPGALVARLHAPGDPGPDSALRFAIVDVRADVAAAGLPTLGEPTPPAIRELIAGAVLPAPAVAATIAAAGLRTPSTAEELGRARAGLLAAPAELIAALVLDAAPSAAILAGDPAPLAGLVAILRARGIVSALPLLAGGKVVVIASSAVLPGAATSLNASRHGFRWYLLPISGLRGGLDAVIGPRASYTAPTGASLAALIAVTVARADRDDPRDAIAPYEARVQLPATAHLDLDGYERLMNTLARMVPIGVVIDTRRIREHHIDPDGAGRPIAFTGRHAHTFRTYVQRRHLGNPNHDRE